VQERQAREAVVGEEQLRERVGGAVEELQAGRGLRERVGGEVDELQGAVEVELGGGQRGGEAVAGEQQLSDERRVHGLHSPLGGQVLRGAVLDDAVGGEVELGALRRRVDVGGRRGL